MEPSVINGLIAGSMVVLAGGVTALLYVASTLIPQISKTLIAYERLADTLDSELGPTLKEVQKVVIGVGELKAIAGHTVTGVTTKVEDVTGTLTKAADQAKRRSSVWGAGLMAGVRAYLEGKHEAHDHEGNEKGTKTSDNRHTSVDRGER